MFDTYSDISFPMVKLIGFKIVIFNARENRKEITEQLTAGQMGFTENVFHDKELYE